MVLGYNYPEMSEGGNSGGSSGASSSVVFANIIFYRQPSNGVVNRVTFTWNTFAGPGGMNYNRLKLGINGIQVIDEDNTQRGAFNVDWDTSRSPFLNSNTPITTINFYGQAIATNGTLWTFETVINNTFKIIAVNPNDDMVFVDTVGSVPTILCLPVLTVDLGSYPNSVYYKNLLFIKDRGGNASQNFIRILTQYDVADSGNSQNQNIEEAQDYVATMNANWGCMKLMFNPNLKIWHVADYYKGNVPSTGTYNPDNIAAINAISGNTISIFNTDVPASGYKPNRNSGGDNIVIINPPDIPYSIAIVCYCGTSTGDRALAFQSNGFFIDQHTGQSGGLPYVRSDGNYKSTGIVFISDASKWYVAGYMETYGWEWKNGDGVPGYGGISTDLIVGTDYNSQNSPYSFTLSTTDVFQNVYVGDSQISIIKKYSTPNYWPRVCVRNSTTNGYPPTYLSQNFTSMEFSYSDGQGRAGRHSVWIVREPRPLVNPTSYHFHPVMRMFRESQGL